MKTAWRSGTGYKHGKEQTVADVVLYEVEKLGNDIELNTLVFEITKDLPAWRCLWVTKTRKEAARYGYPERVNVTDALVLGNDGEGGFLVVLPEGQGCQF